MLPRVLLPLLSWAALVTLGVLVVFRFDARRRHAAAIGLRFGLLSGVAAVVLGEILVGLVWSHGNQAFLVPIFLGAPVAFTIASWAAFAAARRRPAGRS